MGYYLQTAWYPDGKRLAFYDFSADSSQKFIFTLEIEKQKISHPIIELKNKAIGWALGGLAYSPDGKYLIFPDFVQDHLELVALPVTKNGTASAGAIAPLTKFSSGGIPSNPTFAQKGDQISFCLMSQNEDIGIASIDLESSRFAEKENLITNYKGMDIDACWSHDGKIIAFISNRDGFEDIYLWRRENDNIRKLNVQSNNQTIKRYAKGFRTINTVRFIPDKNSVSYLLNGTLFEFNSDSKKSKVILPKASTEMNSLFNYAWSKKTETIFALMLESNFSDYGYLVKINTNDEKFERIIDDRLFLDWSSIAISSNENYLAIRYALPDKQRIEIINTKNKRRKILTEHSTQIPTGDISWSPDGKFLIYGEWNEENEFQIFKIDIETGQRILLSSRSQRRNYLPGQISPVGDEMIFYVDDYDSDIWLIKG
jgi:Tol biopolymer transport system component